MAVSPHKITRYILRVLASTETPTEEEGGGPPRLVQAKGDIILLEPGRGVRLTSPDGTEQKRIRINNNGDVIAEDAPPGASPGQPGQD